MQKKKITEQRTKAPLKYVSKYVYLFTPWKAGEKNRNLDISELQNVKGQGSGVRYRAGRGGGEGWTTGRWDACAPGLSSGNERR